MANVYEKFGFDSHIDSQSLQSRHALTELMYRKNPEGKILPGDDVAGLGCDLAHGYTANDILLAKNTREAAGMYEQMIATDDTYTYNSASAGVPEIFATIWTQQRYEQILQPTMFEKLTTPFQQGDWATESIMIPVWAGNLDVTPYGDLAGGGQTTTNYTWIQNDTVRLMTTLQYGDLATARTAQAKISLVDDLNAECIRRIKQVINRIGFYGYQAGNNNVSSADVLVRVFGLLNNPGLNAFITPATSISNPSSTQWYYKNAFEIIDDVISFAQQAVNVSDGVLKPETDKWILALPTAVQEYVNRPNPLITNSAGEYLKKIYPNMEIIYAPDYNGTGDPIGSTNPNYAQVIFPQIEGKPTALNAYSSVWNDHGMVRNNTYISRAISFNIAGFILPRPFGIVTIEGI